MKEEKVLSVLDSQGNRFRVFNKSLCRWNLNLYLSGMQAFALSALSAGQLLEAVRLCWRVGRLDTDLQDGEFRELLLQLQHGLRDILSILIYCPFSFLHYFWNFLEFSLFYSFV